MKFPEAKKILKEGGVNFKSSKDWEGTINVKDVQKFMVACRNVDMCAWHLTLTEDKGILNIRWNK